MERKAAPIPPDVDSIPPLTVNITPPLPADVLIFTLLNKLETPVTPNVPPTVALLVTERLFVVASVDTFILPATCKASTPLSVRVFANNLPDAVIVNLL